MRFTARTLRPLAGYAVLATIIAVSATRRDGSGVAAVTGAAATGAPVRIIPGTAAAADWLAEIVAPERIAALPEQIEEYSALALDPGPWADRPRFRNFTSETVLAYRPDLVLVTTFTDNAMVARVREAGPRVVTHADPTTWDELVEMGRDIGGLVGEPGVTEALLAQLEARRRALEERENAPPLAVLPYANFGAGGTTWGGDTTLNLAIELAGYRNVAAEAGITGVDDLPLEVILGLDFDVVLMSGSPEQSPSAAALRGEERLASVAAVRDERFLFLPARLFVSGSHTILEAAESVAQQGDAVGR